MTKPSSATDCGKKQSQQGHSMAGLKEENGLHDGSSAKEKAFSG
nr:hypothetical protein [Alicyclobacillus tolerans]